MAIQGNLPFNNAGGALFSGGAAGLGQNYSKAYDNALAMNQANYNNVLGGFQQADAGQVSAQNQIAQGYAGLDNRVLGGIDAVGQARKNDINDQYAMAQSSSMQSLIDRGLGNSTVVDSENRGLLYDKQKSQTQLSDDLAQMKAGYQSNIGLANLSYLSQANNERTNLARNQLSWMDSVSAPFPDAGMYANLAQLYGSINQAGGSSKGAMEGGMATGGGVTKGGHQFAPNSSIDPNAGSAPPVQGAGGLVQPPPGTHLDAQPTSGGYVQPPSGGYAGAAMGGAASQFGASATALGSGSYPYGEFDPGVADAAAAAGQGAMDWASMLPNLY